MADALTHLFTPLKVGSVTMPNRAFWPGHSHQYDDERAIAYYEERARGGYGLIVTSRACEALMGKITPAVHRHGTKIFHQGWYPQNTGLTKGMRDRRDPSLQPSVIAPGAKGVMSKEMEEDEIEASIEQAALWAKRMQEAGADGIELHLSHMHWPSHWLTVSYNRRTDQYGGSIANRLRFEIRTLEAIRKAVGRDFVVGLRRNGLYDTKGGPIETREDSHAFARLLADSGLVDFLSISGYPYYRGMGTPAGAIIAEAALIKQAIGGKITVMSTGDRVVDPRQAEQFLADGKVDMVGLARAGIADPEIIGKARAGQLDDIRTCVGSGQGCLGYWYQGPSICTQNPTVGYESRWGADKFSKAPVAKKVLVVGAGPAGLEAALTAARRGHQVTIYEKDSAPGGQINLIRRSPRRGEFYNVISWRTGQLAKLGVPVHLSTEMTPETVLADKADVVVLATGGQPRRGLYPGSDLPHVFTPWDVMQGKVRDRKHVVVIDAVNYHPATDPVEYFAARNVKVTVITAAPVFCEGGAAPDWPTMWESLQGKDLTIHLNTKVVDITDKAVYCAGAVNVPPGTNEWYGSHGPAFAIEGADAIVLAIGTDPVDDLYKALKGRVPDLVRIGDCLAPRGVEHATYEGHKIGWSIGDQAV